MDSDGGGANEPTSYGLRPPEPADVPARGAPAPTEGQGTRQEGRLLGGRYRLTARLGHGGMGTVWRAHDEVVDREVAVKEPRLPQGVAERQRDTLHVRMQREARAAARIHHPSVVTVHDVVVEDGQPWLVMELVRGESVADVLETGTVEPREAARIGLAVLDALIAAHEAGVLHRDVKPANVLLGRHDRVVLTDFGIARVEGEQGLTETGDFVGSPEFTAPERAAGRRPGLESDLWSLGVLLYAAVEGVSPFRRNNAAATVQAVLSADPPPPMRAAGPLGELITRLLGKRPSTRPKPDEIRRILRAVIAGPSLDTVAANPLATGAPGGSGTLPLRAPAARGPRRRRALLAGVVAATVLAATLLLAPFSPASPFGGDEGSALPEGWRTHQEDRFRMEIAVPAGFERVTAEDDPYSDDPYSDDPNYVGYHSRDGVYEIDVWFRPEESMGPVEAAEALVDSYEEDYYYDEVDGSAGATEFQGNEAAEMWLATHPDAIIDEEVDDHITRQQGLFYGGQGAADQMWRVQVTMPGERGPARDYGEQLYADVVANLEIRDT